MPTPPLQTVSIIRAGADDAPALAALLRDCAAWLWNQGIHQWHPDEFTIEEAADSIARHEIYLLREGDRTLGTFSLQWTDERIWGEDDGKAGYVHRFAVSRDVAGQRLGEQLLRFAETRIAEQGRSFLRLDCWGGNERLCRYYADAGFTRVRDFMVGTWLCALFERSVAQTTAMP